MKRIHTGILLTLLLQSGLLFARTPYEEALFQVEPGQYLEAESFALSHPDKTSASILVWAKDPQDGQIKVLLGHRRFEAYWSNFGGASDPEDRTLFQTALRETQEESMGLFTFASKNPLELPSHDLVREDGKVHRMYISEHAFVAPPVFMKTLAQQSEHTSQEYTNFAWVPVEDLLTLIEKKLEVVPNTMPAVPILPEFREMLQQSPVVYRLTMLQSSIQAWKYFPAHTRGRVNKTGTWDLLVLDGNGVRASEAQKEEVLWRHLQQHAPNLAQIKKKLTKRKVAQIDKELIQTLPPLPYTASDAHMFSIIKKHNAAFTEEQFRAMSEAERIHGVFTSGEDGQDLHTGEYTDAPKEVVDMFAAAANQDPYKQNMIQALRLEKEKSHYLVFYHATQGSWGLAYDIFSVLRNHLMMHRVDEAYVLRGWDILFRDLHKVDDFLLDHAKKMGSTATSIHDVDMERHISNFREGYEKMGLSVNPFLLGNLGLARSESWRLFYNSSSGGDFIDFAAEIEAFFLALDIPLEPYMALLKKYEAIGRKGRLLQIFIHPDVVDEYVYLARSFGVGITPKFSETAARDPLVAFRRDPLKVTPTLIYERLQARVFLHPDLMQDPGKASIVNYLNLTAEEDTAYRRFRNELEQQIATDVEKFLRSPVMLEPGTIQYKAKPTVQIAYEQALQRKGLIPTEMENGQTKMAVLLELLKNPTTTWPQVEAFLKANKKIDLSKLYEGGDESGARTLADQILSRWNREAVLNQRIYLAASVIEITNMEHLGDLRIEYIPTVRKIVIHGLKLAPEGGYSRLFIGEGMPNLEEVEVRDLIACQPSFYFSSKKLKRVYVEVKATAHVKISQAESLETIILSVRGFYGAKLDFSTSTKLQHVELVDTGEAAVARSRTIELYLGIHPVLREFSITNHRENVYHLMTYDTRPFDFTTCCQNIETLTLQGVEAKVKVAYLSQLHALSLQGPIEIIDPPVQLPAGAIFHDHRTK